MDIIEIIKVDEGKCYLCCKDKATTRLKITRPADGDIVAVFRACDNCIKQIKENIRDC